MKRKHGTIMDIHINDNKSHQKAVVMINVQERNYEEKNLKSKEVVWKIYQNRNIAKVCHHLVTMLQ